MEAEFKPINTIYNAPIETSKNELLKTYQMREAIFLPLNILVTLALGYRKHFRCIIKLVYIFLSHDKNL